MQPMHPGDRTYRNQTIRIADLTVVNDVIEDMTFENCTIIGPAVVVLLGPNTKLSNSGFDGDEVGLLWDTGDRDHVIGAIAFKSCTIVGCRFQRIGLGVRRPDREYFRHALGLSDG